MILNEFIKPADDIFALRFLRLMTMPAEKTAAFKAGIIDKEFKKLKKPETPKEKQSYTLFHKLAFNLKRLIRKLPFGKLTLSSYLAALWLIKEHTKMTDEEISSVLKESTGINLEDLSLIENKLFINNYQQLEEGRYILNKNIALPINGEILALKGSEILVNENNNAVGEIFNTPVFKVYHLKTKQKIYITQEDIQDAE
jgi:hypothetical protein